MGSTSSGSVLLPYPAVDAFAQQISVPAVAGVLLDPVNPQLPDSDAPLTHPRAQIRILGQYCICCRLFTSKIGECVLDQRLLCNGSVEVGIPRSVQLRCWVSRQNPVAPGPLPLGKMAEQTQPGHARRPHLPPRQVLPIQPLGLHLQGQSVVPQVVPQGRQLTWLNSAMERDCRALRRSVG